MNTPNDASKRTLTINKVFNAPVKLVWDAWTESAHVVEWWAPKGMPLTIAEYDFRVGGKWGYTTPMPDGSLFVSEGTFLEIEQYKKIVTTADFKPMTEGVELHVLFEADGDKTNFTFSVVHATEQYCQQQEKIGFYNGWGSALNRMEAIVTSLL